MKVASVAELLAIAAKADPPFTDNGQDKGSQKGEKMLSFFLGARANPLKKFGWAPNQQRSPRNCQKKYRHGRPGRVGQPTQKQC